MRRIGIAGLCIVAALTLSALSVVSASATEVLASSATGTFAIKGGAATVFGVSEVRCTSSTAIGSFETAHLGKLTVVFKGCTTDFLGSHSCTSSGASSGEVLIEGPFHLNLARKTSTETAHAAILFLLTSTVSFSCEKTVGTVEARGNFIGLLYKPGVTTEPLVPEEKLEGARLVYGSGKTTKQEDKEFLLALTTPENTVDSAKFETSLFDGSFLESGIELTEEITSATPAGVHLVTG